LQKLQAMLGRPLLESPLPALSSNRDSALIDSHVDDDDGDDSADGKDAEFMLGGGGGTCSWRIGRRGFPTSAMTKKILFAHDAQLATKAEFNTASCERWPMRAYYGEGASKTLQIRLLPPFVIPPFVKMTMHSCSILEILHAAKFYYFNEAQQKMVSFLITGLFVIRIANSGSCITFQISQPHKRTTVNLEKMKNEKTNFFSSFIEKFSLAIFEMKISRQFSEFSHNFLPRQIF
jgi:hypothetical protein